MVRFFRISVVVELARVKKNQGVQARPPAGRFDWQKCVYWVEEGPEFLRS